MTNFLAVLNLDNRLFHSSSNEVKDRMVEESINDMISQVIIHIGKNRDIKEKLDDSVLKLERIEINKRLENGPRLYYTWLRHLTRMVCRDFLKDEKAREAYKVLTANNAD